MPNRPKALAVGQAPCRASRSVSGYARQPVGLDPAGERFAWVRSYFDAKARLYGAAGFPADIGGLLPSKP